MYLYITLFRIRDISNTIRYISQGILDIFVIRIRDISDSIGDIFDLEVSIYNQEYI